MSLLFSVIAIVGLLAGVLTLLSFLAGLFRRFGASRRKRDTHLHRMISAVRVATVGMLSALGILFVVGLLVAWIMSPLGDYPCLKHVIPQFRPALLYTYSDLAYAVPTCEKADGNSVLKLDVRPIDSSKEAYGGALVSFPLGSFRSPFRGLYVKHHEAVVIRFQVLPQKGFFFGLKEMLDGGGSAECKVEIQLEDESRVVQDDEGWMIATIPLTEFDPVGIHIVALFSFGFHATHLQGEATELTIESIVFK